MAKVWERMLYTGIYTAYLVRALQRAPTSATPAGVVKGAAELTGDAAVARRANLPPAVAQGETGENDAFETMMGVMRVRLLKMGLATQQEVDESLRLPEPGAGGAEGNAAAGGDGAGAAPAEGAAAGDGGEGTPPGDADGGGAGGREGEGGAGGGEQQAEGAGTAQPQHDGGQQQQQDAAATAAAAAGERRWNDFPPDRRLRRRWLAFGRGGW